ncbi:transposable element Tcb1 transposase [Trichonephila clavipes]|nr:transposable element Tcb1 transposase [Trichonephila clavipes]
MVIGARLAGTSVFRIANLVGVSRTTVSRIMTAYTNLGKVSSAKHNSGRMLKLKDRDRRVLKRIVARNRKTTLSQITFEMNTHLLNPVSMKTIQRELHTANIHGRVAIRKPLVSGRNAAKRLQWCRSHINWTQLQWEEVIWSDESSFTLFQTTERVFVWRTPAEVFHVDCLVPIVKHGRGSVMILFPGERPVFQYDNSPVHASRCVQTWLHEHDDEVEHLTWCLQSPDLKIIEPLWGYLENKVHALFPPPRTLFELETVLHEEWVQIPMNFVQDLYFSIPRRMQAVIQAKGGPTPYQLKIFIFSQVFLLFCPIPVVIMPF